MTHRCIPHPPNRHHPHPPAPTRCTYRDCRHCALCTVQLVGLPSLIQARVCRNQHAQKRNASKEDYAIQVGDSLPFLEHELHQQLMNKMKVGG